MRYRGILLLLAWLYLGLGVCHAQEKPENPAKKAAKLKEKAESLYAEGQYRKAANLLQDAYVLTSSPDFLYALGRCYSELSLWSEATQSFSLYLSLAPQGPFRKEAQDDLTASQKRLHEANEALLLAQSELQEQEAPILRKKKIGQDLLLGSVAGATAGLAIAGVGFSLSQKSFNLNQEGDFAGSLTARDNAVKLGVVSEVVFGFSLSTVVVSAIFYQRAASMKKEFLKANPNRESDL
jgi:tetratricopeptide (TPR) repeat protein